MTENDLFKELSAILAKFVHSRGLTEDKGREDIEKVLEDLRLYYGK